MSYPTDSSEYISDTFNEFPFWEVPRRPRKESFVDLMPNDTLDLLPGIDPCEASMKAEFVEFPLQPLIADPIPDIAEVSSADTLELPQKRRKLKKRKDPEPALQLPKPSSAPVVKQIGPITWEERRKKIERYLEKRRRRSWGKKICYDCRKRVADHRLRVKGRFVTKEQAIALLGIDHESVRKILKAEDGSSGVSH